MILSPPQVECLKIMRASHQNPSNDVLATVNITWQVLRRILACLADGPYFHLLPFDASPRLSKRLSLRRAGAAPHAPRRWMSHLRARQKCTPRMTCLPVVLGFLRVWVCGVVFVPVSLCLGVCASLCVLVFEGPMGAFFGVGEKGSRRAGILFFKYPHNMFAFFLGRTV